MRVAGVLRSKSRILLTITSTLPLFVVSTISASFLLLSFFISAINIFLLYIDRLSYVLFSSSDTPFSESSRVHDLNMFFPTVAVAAFSALLATATAQSIDPNSVAISTRDYWCTSQISACPLICTQETNGSAATYANDCDPTTLAFDCVCDNGLSPNVSEYSQTIPYFTCTESNNQCQTNCGLSNNACAAACVEDHPCGAQNPTRVNVTSTASTGTASATGTGAGSSSDSTSVYSGFGSSASSTGGAQSGNSNTKSGASRVIVDFGQMYGLGVVAAGIFAGFAMLL